MDAKERAEELKGLLARLHQGEDPSKVTEDFRELLGQVSPEELSAAESALLEGGVPVEEVQRLCSIHEKMLRGHLEGAGKEGCFRGECDSCSMKGKLTGLMVLENENAGILAEVGRMENVLSNASASEEAEGKVLFSHFGALRIHYAKKWNLVYPYLNKHGFTGPGKVMWGNDDEILAEWKRLSSLLKEDSLFLHERELAALMGEVRGMVEKEENVLIPSAEKMLTREEKQELTLLSLDFGYAFLSSEPDPKDFALPEKEASPLSAQSGSVILPTGKMSLVELEAILNTLPVELSFVNKEGKFAYYNQAKRMIFTRTKAQLDGDFTLCHPVKVLPYVEKVMGALQQGQEAVTMDFRQGERFIHNVYYALRDKDGVWLGCLEVSQDVTDILDGMKKLQK